MDRRLIRQALEAGRIGDMLFDARDGVIVRARCVYIVERCDKRGNATKILETSDPALAADAFAAEHERTQDLPRSEE